ncbi:MAG: glutamine--fructose-6-phosphate transaminase (isomerizing) [Candidatus Gastranaerophilales bacterium]|nr:glutamine--fructose-6-phosphate transaminase (isomerizing) [Candidatus Gastranaerophilales bacterium]
MCGIVGYIGNKKAVDIILKGLSYLEYRGYDSAGVALIKKDKVNIFKAPGKLNNLCSIISKENEENVNANAGIGHTRWATHGLPTETNAHPHTCNCKSLTIVHNGIIENYKDLKPNLEAKGCKFQSQTDTEVAAHLIAQEFETHKDLLKAVQSAVKKLKGAYAFCVMHKSMPDRIIAARKNAPLIIGVGDGENFIASDIPAIIEYTKKAIYLSDNQVAEVKTDSIKIYDENDELITNKVENLPFEPIALSKMGYKHFMLKEIHEQPDVVRNVLFGKLHDAEAEVVLDSVRLNKEQLKKINRIQIIACGTSLHAGLVGKYVIEELTKIPVDVEASSEYIYRNTIADENTLVIGISQSGETADTITAIKQVKEKNSHVLIITNRKDSAMARLADSLLPINAGIEVSVAATKSYMAQLLSVYLFAIFLAQNTENADENTLQKIKKELLTLPSKLEIILNDTKNIKEIAKKYSSSKNFIFIARGINYPSALEGALKLKEISYINATGYPAGELKHGPIAMLDETMPVLAILNEGIVYDKVLSNCEEAKARQAKLIGVTNFVDEKHRALFDDIAIIPEISDIVSPALNIVILQLLAYHISEYLGKDVDQPRNLAKSVTVE